MSDDLDGLKEIRKLYGGFWSSRVLLSANNYRVFEHLGSSLTALEVAESLKTDVRATTLLLDALAAMGLLKKSGIRYKNTPLSNRFLISKSPFYQGDIIRHADTLWKNWSGLDRVIRTGKPYHIAHDHESFIRGMHNLAMLKAKDVVKAIGMKGVRRALDLGGGAGTYSIEMARKGVSVTLFDRPETVKIAKDIIGKSGITNLQFIRGDLLYDDIGNGYDLVFISHVLHSCSEGESLRAIENSRKALNRNGRIAIQEFHLEENRTHPVQSALFSINMLVNTPAGRCYSPSEIRRWLTRSGFRDITEKVIDDSMLIIGEKGERR
jgi:ubiquinone/menaquinone biosynthesis C-methylase UbiE